MPRPAIEDAPSPSMDIKLLGRPAIVVDGEDLTPLVKYRKGWALLGYLAAHPGSWRRRESLADMLWPRLDPSAARSNLRQTLSNLASVLDRARCLRRDRDAIEFVATGPFRIDLDLVSEATISRAASGSSASRDWREHDVESRASRIDGVFLEGVELPDAPEFDRWLVEARGHFQHRTVRLLSSMCVAQREEGRLDDAIATARRLVRIDHLDEAHAVTLATLLLRVGERDGALDVIDAHARALQAQLGATPGPALTELRGRITMLGRPTPLSIVPEMSELRWVTILHCDVPLRHDDPDCEDAGLVLAVRDAVARRGGVTVAAVGRGFLAVFGLGDGTEHAATRAILAARDIARRLDGKWSPRAGVCAGRALCRIENGLPQITGELPDLAMRIGWTAEPGEVLIDDAVARQAAERFSVTRVGERAFRGMDGVHSLYRLGPERQPDAVVAAASPSGECALVGREGEFQALRQAWDEARGGRPRMLLVRGAAGLGKTRLVRELADWVECQGEQVHRVRCRLEVQHRALAPLVDSIALAAGVDDALVAGGDRLRALVRDRHPGLAAEHVNALVDLLRAAAGASDRPIAAKDLAFAAIIAWFERRLAQGPTLIVVDDLHWADDVTREFVRLLARTFKDRRTLLVLTTRPTDAPEPWNDAAEVLALAPLSQEASLALVDSACPKGGMSLDERRRIVSVSSGIPLFLERMVKAWTEGDHHLRPIHELLLTQIDALGPDKFVLRAASVLGEQFDVDDLGRLLPDLEVSRALALARARGLVMPRGNSAHAFRHALIRDAAYEGLPIGKRRALHLTAARDLEQRDAARPEDIARHFSLAAAWAEAGPWWLHAARAALAAGYAATAIGHCREALGALETMQKAQGRPEFSRPSPESNGGETIERRIQDARLLLGFATQMAEGYGSAAAYGLFRDVAREIESDARSDCRHAALFAALGGMFMGGSSQGAIEGMRIARRLQALARGPEEQLAASSALGNVLFWAGAFEEALAWQRKGIALGERIPVDVRLRGSVDDPAVVCRAFASWTLWFLGEGDAAVSMALDAVRQARSEQRVHALCFALVFATGVHWFREDAQQVALFAGEALTLSRRHGFALWEGASELFLAWAQASRGAAPARSAVIEAAARLSSAYQAGMTTSRWIAARALIALDAWAQAEELLELSVREAHLHEDQYCLPDLIWLQGVCMCRRGCGDDARERFTRAVAMARRQGALGLLARFGKPPGLLGDPCKQANKIPVS